MTRPLRLALVLAALAALPALAQRAAGPPTPEDRFHEAARLYVAGDTTRAARAAEAGLAQAPADPQLRALLTEIRRRPPPQPPQGGAGQDRRPQQGQDRPEDGGARPPEQPPPQQAPQGGPGDQPDRTPPPQSPPPPTPEPGSEGPPQEAPPRAGPTPDGPTSRMTRDEAEALLRALGADERRLLRARQRASQPRSVEKDW